nr:MAG TPA: hypothetical protein [Caudoviricetes sp.]
MVLFFYNFYFHKKNFYKSSKSKLNSLQYKINKKWMK